ncbi:MAG TPA: alanine-zipper protein [Gammaproteobacteria bacterium]
MNTARILIANSLAAMLLIGCTTTGQNADLETAVKSAQASADEAKAIALRSDQKADEALAKANQALSAANGAQSTADQALKEAREAKALARDAAAQSEKMFEKSIAK